MRTGGPQIHGQAAPGVIEAPVNDAVVAPNTRWGDGTVDISEASLPALKAKWILRNLPQSQQKLRVLDYGCGEGKLLRVIATKFPHYQMFGTDIRVPRDNRGFEFIPAKELAATSSFDVITCVDVLEHVPDLEVALRQIHALLKPEGVVLLFVPAEGQPLSPHSFYRMIFGNALYAQTKDHVHAYRRRELYRAAARFFRVDDVSYSYHFFGSLMDATFFAACKIPAVSRWWWNSNPYYRPNAKPSLAATLVRWANVLCYVESRMLSRCSFFASGIHIKASKPRSKTDGSTGLD